mmetsp:Transcript_37061/g.94824  ORF Transcript_37061/g.94824 Transcript_37061/m.94824 type:complete len:440 (-) Transcript_37061:3-1322(-)
MRVVVHLSAIENQLALRLEHLLNVCVGLLNVLALEVPNLLGVASALVDGLQHACAVFCDDAILDANPVIVLSESRGLVDDTCTRCCGDVLVRDEAPDLALIDGFLEVWEERLVGDADQGLTWHLLQNLEILFGILLDARTNPIEAVLANDPLAPIPFFLELQVLQLRVDTKSEVGWQGPGRRRPRKDVGVLLVLPLELHDDGGVGNLLVILRHLEVGQRSGQGRAVCHNAEGAVNQALVEKLLEAPPNGLHEGQIHGLVVVVEVDPPAKPLHDLTPFIGVHLHNGPALLVVLVDPHLQHVLAALDVEFLVDDALYWHTVAVPAEPPLNVIAALVRMAAHHVLDGTGQDVPVVRQAGSEGGPIVEVERLLALRLPQALLERIDIFPILERGLLFLREARFLRERREGGLGYHPDRVERTRWAGPGVAEQRAPKTASAVAA